MDKKCDVCEKLGKDKCFMHMSLFNRVVRMSISVLGMYVVFEAIKAADNIF